MFNIQIYSVKYNLKPRKTRVVCYPLLSYGLVWFDEWESMILNAMAWYFNAMVWYLNAMLCYSVCCKRYA